MFADIIVDLSVEALDRTFQYIIPKQWEGEVFAGCCVKIPFGRGNRLIRGYVMNITEQAAWPVERMKEISEIEKKELPVESKLIQLAAWIRQRYQGNHHRACFLHILADCFDNRDIFLINAGK